MWVLTLQSIYSSVETHTLSPSYSTHNNRLFIFIFIVFLPFLPFFLFSVFIYSKFYFRTFMEIFFCSFLLLRHFQLLYFNFFRMFTRTNFFYLLFFETTNLVVSISLTHQCSCYSVSVQKRIKFFFFGECGNTAIMNSVIFYSRCFLFCNSCLFERKGG